MAYSKVNEMTDELAEDFIGYKLGKNIEIPSNLTAKTLRRLAADLEREHGELFKNMVLKALSSAQTDETVFLKIAKEMFTDQIINWGRIAVLYTFAGHMAVYCQKNNKKTESENVADWVSSFVKCNMTDWIVKSGGWDAFNDYFREKQENNDMSWGNVLCTVGLVAGAAGAALVFAR